MPSNPEFDQLQNEVNTVVGWLQDYMPDPDDAARCFEFLVLMETASILSESLSLPVIVNKGVVDRFAGAPGDRSNYNSLRIGDFCLFFGVGFSRTGATWHYPDVTITFASQQDMPLAVIECKHYSLATLPKQIVMAFIGLLHDLDFAVFSGCRKLNISWQQQNRYAPPRDCGVARNARVCDALELCQSRLVTTIPVSAPVTLLQSEHDFLIEVKITA